MPDRASSLPACNSPAKRATVISSAYQLAFFSPGITPAWASSRSLMRQIWNLRMLPLERPVIAQRRCERVGLESRGNFANAAKFLSFFNCRRRSAYFLTSASRLFCFATQAVVAILLLPLRAYVLPVQFARLAERHAELP